MPRLLVMGVGNILLTDEGAGVRAVQELEKEEWPEGVEFLDGGTFTQDIFFVFKDYDGLVVLDCVKGGREPGTLYVLDESDLRKEDGGNLSVHDIDLLDSLKMAEMLGKRPKMRVVGIEPKTLTWNMELTPEVEARMPAFLEAARREIRRFLDDWSGQGS